MKVVALTSNTSWYLYNFRKNTILALIDHGYQVIVIAPVDQYSSLMISLGVKFIPLKIDSGGMNPFKDLYTIFTFINIFKKNKIDVILSFTPKNNIYSAIAASFFNIKVVNNIAGLGGIFMQKNFMSYFVRHLYKFSLKRVDKVFFQNVEDQNFFLDYKIISGDRSERIPGSGVDLKRFIPMNKQDDNVIKFILIARMLYDKGIEQYVEAARTLKKIHGNVEFYLLGFLDVDNPSSIKKEEMNRWVEEKVITYLGVSNSVENELAKCDCVVLPSYYREGVPKSLLEGAAMAKPIITTNNIGCRDVVDHGKNGFICEPRSSASLTDAMEMFINLNPEERYRMGQESRLKVIRDFDEEIIIKRYLSTVIDLLRFSTVKQ
jgi:glycosyltransferase involved in cell wall biosynthesis